MGSATRIGWTDATWNWGLGCRHQSEECDHCYAEGMAARLVSMAAADEEAGKDPGRKAHYRHVVDAQRRRWNGTDFVVLDALLDPLRWDKPRMIFVNSMGDTFRHDAHVIAAAFGVMLLATHHRFQVLTKYARQMRSWFAGLAGFAEDETPAELCLRMAAEVLGQHPEWKRLLAKGAAAETLRNEWPARNVCLMVTAGLPSSLWRIDELLACPAALRGVSVEPMLDEVDLRSRMDRLDWIICGGESGPRARPLAVRWARDLRDQCVFFGVPFHFKQWGEFDEAGVRVGKLGADGNLRRTLDGRTWDDAPRELAPGRLASTPRRLLVTGSRDWSLRGPIRRLVASLPPGSVVIHGACGCDTRFDPSQLRGADGIADEVARARGLEVVPVPAEWTRLQKAAGMVRNRQMLEEERPDLVVGFPVGRSPGTRGMMQLAERAGVPVEDLSDVDAGEGACDAGVAGGVASTSFGAEPTRTGRAGRHPAGALPILTIGYQGWKPAELGAACARAGVSVVVDVRDHPWSPAPQWCQAELAKTVEAHGLRYAWAGDLVGNPRANREDASDAGGGILERFRSYVMSGERSRLQRFAARLRATSGLVCLLCGCQDHDRCHRGVLIDELVRAGVVDPARVLHLERPGGRQENLL